MLFRIARRAVRPLAAAALAAALLALAAPGAPGAPALPVLTSVTPSAGPAAGGTKVGILGANLSDVKEVLFGGVPSSAVTVVSDGALEAVSPPHAPGLVDVTAVNAAGTSATSTGDIFTFEAPIVLPAKPIVGAITASHPTWRAGTRLASLARRRAPVGTTFVFTLNTTASLKLTFARLRAGRAAGHRCVAPTRANAHHRRCTRRTTAGTLTIAGHAGSDRLAFQGRLAAGRTLRAGRYAMALVAQNSAGTSAPQRTSFTIV